MTVTIHQEPAATVGPAQIAHAYGAAQVFLSYSGEDLSLKAPGPEPEAATPVVLIRAIEQLLLDQGFTVWDSQRLHFPNVTEEVAVSRSIEACDNFVMLLSSHFLRSALCLQGLLFAISMNKRIVPVLIAEVERDQLPTQLQMLPVIDLQHINLPLAQAQAGQQLLHTIAHEAAYHQAHKQLLVQSLRWERQQRNPCLLMRGESLQQYYRWLETAQRHPQYPPIRVQTLFVEASQTQPQPLTWQAHMIYTAANARYAGQLSNLLQLFSKCTSFDHLQQLQRGKPEWHRRQAIEQALNCLCVVSPEALQDEVFLNDLNYALSLHKRLILLSRSPIQNDSIPAELGRCPRFTWPTLDTTSAEGFSQLFRLLEQNETQTAYHTQLLQWALQWDRHNRDHRLLLHRHLLSEALTWLQSQPEPGPTPLQTTYIQTSRSCGAWWSGRR